MKIEPIPNTELKTQLKQKEPYPQYKEPKYQNDISSQYYKDWLI